MSKGFKYICEECGSTYEISKDLMLCPKCKEENLTGKALKGVLSVVVPEEIKWKGDIFDFLPIEKEFFPQIKVADTPLNRAYNVEKHLDFEEIYIKNDGLCLSGSLKDRASFLVSAFAKKFGYDEVVLASTGNAASSMAAISAAAGLKAIIFLPKTAPKAKMVQCLQYGAELIIVDGNYDCAFDLSLKYSLKNNKLNRNTAYNPMTVEGKKTVSLEIFNDLSIAPDYVFVPVGDGVIISGVIKGFLDLKKCGAIDKIPKIIGVQAENSSFIAKAFKTGIFDENYRASTLADSISVDIARNGYKAVADMKNIAGEFVNVNDDEILYAQKYFSKMTGVFSEPAASASFAGFLKLRDKIEKNSKIVLLATGNGLKDIDNAMKKIDFPEVLPADLDVIEEFLSKKSK